jgi:acyl dehydratase
MSAFYEDLSVGSSVELGSYLFTAEAIKAFARRYDPQPFHIDEHAAERGPFGRLAASGWHTAAIWMKLYVAHRRAIEVALEERGEQVPVPGPSPGFRNLKWSRPVFAGDRVSFASTIADKRTRPDPRWGLVFQLGTGRSEGGQVLSFESGVLWERRPAG